MLKCSELIIQIIREIVKLCVFMLDKISIFQYNSKIMQTSQELEERLKKQRRDAEEEDARRRARALSLTYLDTTLIHTPTELRAMTLVPEEEARKAQLVPIEVVGKKLIIAVFKPDHPSTKEVIDRLKKNYDVTIAVTSMNGLEHVWNYYQYIHADEKNISGSVAINDEDIKKVREHIKKLEEFGNELRSFKNPLTSKIFEIVLAGALSLRASDIHLEPTKDGGILRVRIDGLLHTSYTDFTPKTYGAIIMRVKLLSNLKLNIKDEAQDGRFTIDLADGNVEIRTSIIPSEYGETAVLRLLDPSALKVRLEDLGLRSDDLDIIKKTIAQPNGLILNTGPTGSGKTTTLYAFLKYVFKPEIKIITVEDPIEYHLAGVSQTQVDTDAGYTFASGLRSILRQDPNIILVGEIRDRETAEIAMNAALTGHVVFSTLHTNDSIGAVPRLLDLGINAHTIGPALSLIIAQRLVRVLCPKCKEENTSIQATQDSIDKFIEKLPARVDKKLYKINSIFKPKGCASCAGLGYRGRTSIFELFIIDEDTKEVMYENPKESTLRNLAIKQGMVSMQDDGILKVIRGVTSFDEVERVTGTIEWLNKKTK